MKTKEQMEKESECIRKFLDKIEQSKEIINKPIDCYRNTEI